MNLLDPEMMGRAVRCSNHHQRALCEVVEPATACTSISPPIGELTHEAWR